MNRLWVVGVLLLGGYGCGSSNSGDPLDVFSLLDSAPHDWVGDAGDTDQSNPIDQGAVLDLPDTDELDATEPPELCTEGEYCDDGDSCTFEDLCTSGICAGTAYPCDDGRPCTVDLCDGYGGCAAEVATGNCLINNVCYAKGETALFNGCIRCTPESDPFAFSLAENGASCGEEDPCLTQGTCADGACGGEATGCDDGNPCTDSRCDVDLGCVHPPNFDLCEDGDPCTLGDQCEDGACVSGLLPLDCDDENPCTLDLCTPLGCEYAHLDVPCSDGDFCTEEDACGEGLCVPGAPRSCNDGNDCTGDSCNSVFGCEHSLLDNICCVGSVHVCNDGNPCTIDICDSGLGDCSYELVTGECSDGDACTGSDSCNAEAVCVGQALDCDDGNPCTADSCALGSGCVHTPTGGGCDDGNACTDDDNCFGLGQCGGTPINCSDGNPCTQDLCSAISGCLNQVLEGDCTDGNSCTENDQCVLGECTGAAIDCDDGNECTADSCHPAIGCVHLLVSGPCDDGLDCTENDQCVSGTCEGTQFELCCVPEFSGPTTKVTLFAIGSGGVQGEALDVDNDSGTCSPQSNCEAGLDNSLSAFSAIANEPLAEEIANGGLIALIEHYGFNTEGTPYTIRFWEGEVVDPACDIQNQSCDYWIKESAVTESCSSWFGFDNATVVDGNLVAGGLGYAYPIMLKIGGANILLSLNNARLEAQLTVESGELTGLDGVMGGAVSKAQLSTALQAIPDDDLPEGISKQALLTLVNVLIKNDIDIDGDGIADAASIGIRLEGLSGSISGVEP